MNLVCVRETLHFSLYALIDHKRETINDEGKVPKMLNNRG